MVRRTCRILGLPVYRVGLSVEEYERFLEPKEAQEEVGECSCRRLGLSADREDIVVRELC